jgi:hypothetical protein
MGDHYGALYLNGGTGKKNILSKDRFLRDLLLKLQFRKRSVAELVS